jgi:hypothetical protein
VLVKAVRSELSSLGRQVVCKGSVLILAVRSEVSGIRKAGERT